MNFDKRIILSALAVASLAAGFWLDSRYPELNQKAAVTGDIPLSDTLSFEAVLIADSDDPTWKKIAYSLVNWAETNRKGMTFGVLIGAGFLTLLGFWRRTSSGSTLVNTLAGIATGTPLGVCVNCAAPIAKGIHDGGARVETTMAMMFSAPSLNVVVLVMLFSIFPAYLVAIKLGLVFLVVLVAVPLLSKFAFKEENARQAALEASQTACLVERPLPGWRLALGEVGVALAKNLWYITRKTVPLMVVAGALGVLATQLIPINELLGAAPSLPRLSLVASIGLFLPAPIALDLVLAQAFLIAGAPIGYVMALLFTLGIFSIYSFFIVWGTISPRVAISFYVLLTFLGIGGGYAAQAYHDRALEDLLAGSPAPLAESQPAAAESERPVRSMRASPRHLVVKGRREADVVYDAGGIRISSVEFERRSPPGERPFSQLDARARGISRPILFDVQQFFPPFFNGRGLSAGDVNNDGWPDVVVATREGARLFVNRGDGSFVRSDPQLEGAGLEEVFVAALVDIDDDGWQDLYLTTWGSGKNYFYLNQGGHFPGAPLDVPNSFARVTLASPFADVDRDGDLDFLIGNWFMGFLTEQPSRISQNRLVFNDDMSFRPVTLRERHGETLAGLFSDFNMDGYIDLIVGNDFAASDMYYLGSATGELTLLGKNRGIPITTHTTMSIDTADLNNDLVFDLYLDQITGSFQSDWLATRPFTSEYCEAYGDATDRERCLRNMDARSLVSYFGIQPYHVGECDRLHESDRDDCRAMVLMMNAVKEMQPELCGRIQAARGVPRTLCEGYFAEAKRPKGPFDIDEVQQIKKRNVLLIGTGGGRFADRTEEMGVELAGWGWNAVFADLDDDEWQDLYVANGTWWSRTIPSNVFFHNVEGQRFEARQSEFGLQDYRVVGAYVTVDIDNDGDLDIVSNPVNGPVALVREQRADQQLDPFRAQGPSGQPIRRRLQDHRPLRRRSTPDSRDQGRWRLPLLQCAVRAFRPGPLRQRRSRRDRLVDG